MPLVNDEPGTISWFAIQEGPSRVAIFDTFDDEAGRDAHLNGRVAAALTEKAKAGDLFEKNPEIHKLGINFRNRRSPTPLLREGTPHAGASGLLWMAPGVLLDWRHCGVDLVVILHHEIDIGREFHGLGERFQF